MTNKKCSNCMWGDQCSTIGDCEYYDPLEDDNSESNNEIDRRLWQDYLHCLNRDNGCQD